MIKLFHDKTGRRYLSFLWDVLPLLLEDIPLATCENMYYQHDGAHAHNARIVKESLTFREKCIATHGPVERSLRFPDLTPLDLFLWGHLKKFFVCLSSNKYSGLENKITNAYNLLNQILTATSRECVRRSEVCLQHDGRNFKQFI